MKFNVSIILSTSAMFATSFAATSATVTYNLRVGSNNPAIKDTLLGVKDESATTAPNPLGVWSSGEPRNAYTVTLSSAASSKLVFELNGALKMTHSILTGPPEVMGLYDVPIGADPTPAQGQKIFTNTFARYDNDQVLLAERYNGVDPENSHELMGAGTWRACKGDSEIDYQIYWYDGLSRLQDFVKGCEAITLHLQEAKPTPASDVPEPTGTAGPKPCSRKAFHA